MPNLGPRIGRFDESKEIWMPIIPTHIVVIHGARISNSIELPDSSIPLVDAVNLQQNSVGRYIGLNGYLCEVSNDTYDLIRKTRTLICTVLADGLRTVSCITLEGPLSIYPDDSFAGLAAIEQAEAYARNLPIPKLTYGFFDVNDLSSHYSYFACIAELARALEQDDDEIINFYPTFLIKILRGWMQKNPNLLQNIQALSARIQREGKIPHLHPEEYAGIISYITLLQIACVIPSYR